MANKIAKTIARQKEKIAEGQFYEAHQQLRVIASRYIKSADYTSAGDILSNGAVLLLKADQGGSGGDLGLMLLNEVYNKGELECNDAHKQRLIEILHAFPRGESTRKRFIQEMISWSGKYGGLERGDPDLQHAAGALYAEEGEVYDAERHLLLGSSASPPILASLHYKWYTADSPHLAPLYASRSLLPYLVLGNLPSAVSAFQTFTSTLTTTNPTLFTQTIESSKSSIRIFPSLPLLNFLAALLLAVQKGDSGLFKTLGKHYVIHLRETEELWKEALANVGEIWFGIRIPRQGGNPLMDMMGSMLFGGGGSGDKGTPRAGTPKPGAAGAGGKVIEEKKGGAAQPAPQAPPSMDLD